MNRPLRALVVEDHPETLSLLRKVFERANIVVEGTATLADALRRLQSGVFGVVLLDLTLPDSTDESGVVAIQRSNPLVPIVVYTGAGPDLEERCLAAGAQDFIHKARVEGTQLIERIRFAVIRHERVTRLYTPLIERLESAACIAREGAEEAAKVSESSATHRPLPVDELKDAIAEIPAKVADEIEARKSP